MKKIFFLALASLALASCEDNENNELTSPRAATITATIGESSGSRAVDSSWTAGDAIGISSSIGGEDGPYINFKYVTEDGLGKFRGKNNIFFYKPMTLTAYYPFAGEEKEAPGEAGVIKADTRPDKQTAEKRPTIDFLWDSKTNDGKNDFTVSSPVVNFTFAHKMSKLSFTFESSEPQYDLNDPDIMISDGVDVGTMISYEIEGLGVEGTFDTATGVCAIDESIAREGLKIQFEKAKEEMQLRSMDPIIVFPQKNESGYILHITTDELNKEGETQKFVEQNYKCALRFANNELLPGYHYQFKIKVTKYGLIIGDLSIAPWEAADEKFITATIDGGEKEFQE